MKTEFYGLSLNLYGTYKEYLKELFKLAENKEKKYICYLNADVFNRAMKDAEFYSILKKSGLNYADGMSIVYALKRIYKKETMRITAADFFKEFLLNAQRKELKLYFLGGSAELAEAFKNKVHAAFPELEYQIHHGYLTPELNEILLAKIQQFKPNLIICGMGSPRQEQWTVQNLQHLECPIWHVGAAMEFYTQKRYRAPKWAREHGMEWIFRLIQEPMRLAKRYLIGNWIFLYNLYKYRKKNPHGNK